MIGSRSGREFWFADSWMPLVSYCIGVVLFLVHIALHVRVLDSVCIWLYLDLRSWLGIILHEGEQGLGIRSGCIHVQIGGWEVGFPGILPWLGIGVKSVSQTVDGGFLFLLCYRGFGRLTILVLLKNAHFLTPSCRM